LATLDEWIDESIQRFASAIRRETRETPATIPRDLPVDRFASHGV